MESGIHSRRRFCPVCAVLFCIDVEWSRPRKANQPVSRVASSGALTHTAAGATGGPQQQQQQRGPAAGSNTPGGERKAQQQQRGPNQGGSNASPDELDSLAAWLGSGQQQQQGSQQAS